MDYPLFAVFALLPLGLLSLRDKVRGAHAGFGFLAALAPVIASGIGSLIKGKQQSSAEKKQREYEKQQALAAEEANRRAWEAQQNSPEALAARQRYTMQLGRLAGAMGGVDKLPPSILNYLQSQRKTREYVPGANYVEKPKSGAGIWDVAEGAANALSYFDYNKLKSQPKLPAATGFGPGSKFGPATPTNTSTSPLQNIVGKYAVTNFTRTPWDQTHLQYSGGAGPSIFSPTNYDPITGKPRG